MIYVNGVAGTLYNSPTDRYWTVLNGDVPCAPAYVGPAGNYYVTRDGGGTFQFDLYDTKSCNTTLVLRRWCDTSSSCGSYDWNCNDHYLQGGPNAKISFPAGVHCINYGGNNYYFYFAASNPYPLPPVCDFSANVTKAQTNTSIIFTDLTTHTPDTWSWTFGDGGTSAVKNPVHEYTAAGTYTVVLTASNIHGQCTKTKTSYIVITTSPPTGAPVAWFSATPTTGPAPLTVQITDESTGSPTSWYWAFGDFTNGTGQNPSHVYTPDGLYSPKLNCYNASGGSCVSRDDYIVVVSYQPTIGNARGRQPYRVNGRFGTL